MMKKRVRIYIARILIILTCLNLDFSGLTVEAATYDQRENIEFQNLKWLLTLPYSTHIITVGPCEVLKDGSSMVLPTKKQMKELASGYSGIKRTLEQDESGECAIKVSFNCDIYGIQENVLNRTSELVIHEDYPVFPNDNTITEDSGHDVFQGNETIKQITVNTNNQNGFRIRKKTFKDMSGLKTVDINVGDGEIRLDGSVFEGCTNLTNVTLSARTITIDGGLNFSGCSMLSTVVFKGNVTFTGEKDFQGCNSLSTVEFNKDTAFDGTDTFSNLNLSDTNITFTGDVTNISEGKSAVAFTGCKGIGTVSIGAKNEETSANIGGNFISNSTLTNLNIEDGTTTLAADAINNCKIDGISFNASTKVGKGALVGCTVGNMYFNTPDVKSNGAEGAIGKNTTVQNIYFNHYDFFRNSDKVTELDNVPLGMEDYSLNCKNMYFLSPNFNKINNSYYNSKVVTNVYGYGGTLSTYNDEEEKITSKEMFEQWTGNNNTYYNIIQLTSGQKQGKLEEKKLFVEMEDQKVTFDLSSLEIFAKYNENITTLDQLPTDEAGNVRTGEFRLQYTKDSKADTNFNYKVLTEATEASASGQYTYTDEKGVKYITCQKDKLELGVGTYHYYVQAAGETWPLTIEVKQNKISKLKVLIKDKGQTDGKIHVTEGDELAKVKEYITVMGVLADEETEVELNASQYKVVKADLSETAITAQDTELLVHYQGLEKMEKVKDVEVHPKKITSFVVACDKANMPIGSQLTLEDLTLTEGTYDNPLDTPIAKIYKGYHFLQDGQETDVYTIKSGENKISVTYEGCVEQIAVTGVSNQVEDYEINCKVKEVELYQKSSLDISEVTLENVVYADERLDGFKVETVKSGFTFVVNGEETDTVKLEDGENTIRVRYNGLDKNFTVKAYEQSIDRIEVEYCGPTEIYEGNEIPKDTSVLMVTVYYKHPYEVSLLLSNFEVSYDTYHIVPGEDNEIYVYYKGVKSSQPIHVLGLKNGIKGIKTVEYRGSNKTGTSLEKEDFYVELEYLSGKVVTSEENPSILDNLNLSLDKLKDGNNSIDVVYDGALTTKVEVVANAEGIPASAMPETTRIPEITSGGSIVSKDTEAPKLTVAPTNTVEPKITVTPKHTVAPKMTVAPGSISEAPVVTQTPQETDANSVVPTVSPIAQPQKDSSFTLQGVTYKVTGVTNKGGSVSITGYDKEALKVKLQTAVSLNGYKYTVTKIEKGAFRNCSKLSGTINLTKNVKVVGDSAFSGCKNIKKVVFGSNVTQIGKSSFCNCSKLSTIQFKTGSVKKIGKNAFKGISKKYTVKTTKALKKTYAKRLKGAM